MSAACYGRIMSPAPESARSKGAVVFFFTVLLGALLGFAYVLRSFIPDLIMGLLIAGISRPLFQRICGLLGGRRHLAAVLATVLLTVLIAVPLAWLGASLYQQAGAAYGLIRDALASEAVGEALRGEGWFGGQLAKIFGVLGMEYTPESVKAAAANAAGTIAAFLTSHLNAAVTNVLLALYHLALMLVVVFYGYVDGPAFKRRIFELSPLPDEEEELIVQKFGDVGKAILFGSGAGAVLQGVLGGLAMWVCGVPSPVFWGVIMAVLAFLPVIGASLVYIPTTIYLLVLGEWWTALSFFAFCSVQGLLIDNLLTPRLVGGRMRMHNLLIFLALVGGIATFGMGGVVYGPLFAAFVLTLLGLYERAYRTRLFSADRPSRAP